MRFPFDVVIGLTFVASVGCVARSSPGVKVPRELSGGTAEPQSATPAASQSAAVSQNPPAGQTDVPTTPSPSDSNPDASRRAARTWGWVGLAIGGEAAIVAAVTSFMMLHEKNVRDDGCDANKVCSPRGFEGNTQLDSLGPWNAAAWTVAAVGIGGGAILLLTNPARSTSQTALSVTPFGTGAGVSLRSVY